MQGTVSTKELRAIRDEIKELRILYKSLIERVSPVEEPSADDKRIIRKKERIVKEDELIRALD